MSETFCPVSSRLQTQLSRWVWHSSWFPCSAPHTRLSTNMCSAPFVGKKHSLPYSLSSASASQRLFMVHISNYARPCFRRLSSLVEDCPQGLKDCREPSLGLEGLLRQRARELQGKEESQVIHMSQLASYKIKMVIQTSTCVLV